MMELHLDDTSTDASIHSVLTALAALPSLSYLGLTIEAFSESNGVQLSLLAACPSLTDLKLECRRGFLKLNDTQMEQIRTSLGHPHRINIGSWMRSDELARLLKLPVTARWQDIGEVSADERTGEMLLRLPTLTTLEFGYYRRCRDVEFLPQLSLLTALDLSCDRHDQWLLPADALLATLVRCIALTELGVSCAFKSSHWSALFAKLPLKKLTICRGELESLQCFAAGPITQSLESLSLIDLNLPLNELAHLSALRRLRTMHIRGGFLPRLRLDDATIDSLSPPTLRLPALTEFEHTWEIAGATDDDEPEDDGRVRRGPSFEWMQARRGSRLASSCRPPQSPRRARVSRLHSKKRSSYWNKRIGTSSLAATQTTRGGLHPEALQGSEEKHRRRWMEAGSSRARCSWLRSGGSLALCLPSTVRGSIDNAARNMFERS